MRFLAGVAAGSCAMSLIIVAGFDVNIWHAVAFAAIALLVVYIGASMERTDCLDSVLDDVVKWADETFPDSTTAGRIEHLRREVEELAARPYAGEELADIVMIAAHHASRVRVCLHCSIKDKLAVNRLRSWLPRDAAGVAEHDRKEN